jgi:hypothetical protein
MSTTPKRNALPALRDRFLLALDEQDDATLDAVKSYMVGCVDLMPSATCAQLGLKPGSTYGEGAEAVAKARAAAATNVVD